MREERTYRCPTCLDTGWQLTDDGEHETVGRTGFGPGKHTATLSNPIARRCKGPMAARCEYLMATRRMPVDGPESAKRDTGRM